MRQTDTSASHRHDLPSHGLVLWPPGACLLSECAAWLNTHPRRDMRDVAIVLPTRRLSLHLLSALAQHHGAIIPPVMTTFDALLRRLCEHFDIALPVPASNRAVETFLSHELEHRQFRHVRPGMEHEFAYFLGESIEGGLDQSVHTRLREIVQRDVYRSTEQVGALHERLDEIKSLEDSLRGALMGHGLSLPQDATRIMSERLNARLTTDPTATLPFKRLELIGFTTVARIYIPLLRTLASRPDCRVWLNESPLDGDEHNPLAELAASLGSQSRASQSPSPTASSTIYTHRHSSILAECRAATRLAADYIAAGVDPSRIGLILPDETLYAPLLKPLLGNAELDANMSMGDPLADTTFGKWLHGLTEVLTSGEESLRTLAWTLNPITLEWLASLPAITELSTPNGTSDFVELGSRLVQDICRPDAGAGIERLARSSRHPVVETALNQTREILRGWIDHDQPRPRPLHEWVAALRSLVDTVIPSNAPHANDHRRAVERVFDRLTEASGVSRRPVTRSALLRAIRDHALSDTLPPATDALSGVQVLSLAEARGVPFSVGIILGCVEGTFPRGIPADTLLDNHLKTAAGLAGVTRFERLEDMTFGLLAARLPRLHLFHADDCLGEAKARSRFIERLNAEGRAVEIFSSPDAAHPNVNSDIPFPPPVAAEGHITNGAPLLARQSATSLERLIRCPYSFLLHRLGLKTLDLPALNTAAREESRWLHAILEAFFSGNVDDRPVIDPWPDSLPLADFSTFARERLNRLTTLLAPPDAPMDLLIQLREVSWPRFVDHWARLVDEASLRALGSNLKEAALEPVFHIAGTPVALDGRFDSVDFVRGMTLITDYKRRHVPDNPGVGQGTHSQLAYYAITLRAAFPDDPRTAHEATILGYWSILDGKWNLRAVGDAVVTEAVATSLMGQRARPNDTSRVVDRVTRLWSWRHETLSTPGTPFAADPGQCAMCAFEGVCRKSDPAHMDRVKGQASLRRQMTTLDREADS